MVGCRLSSETIKKHIVENRFDKLTEADLKRREADRVKESNELKAKEAEREKSYLKVKAALEAMRVTER